MSAHLRSSNFCPVCHELLPEYLKGGVHPECHRRQLREMGLEDPDIYERAIEHEKREAVVKPLTSGQQYRQMLQRTFGYDGDREIPRLRRRLGNIQVEDQTSDRVYLTLYPSGGRQRIPLAIGTQAVDAERLTQIQLAGKFPHALVNINPQCSGNPCGVLCRIKA